MEQYIGLDVSLKILGSRFVRMASGLGAGSAPLTPNFWPK